MFPSMSSVSAKAAHVASQVASAARNIPNVVSHMVSGAETTAHPATSWAATNPYNNAIAGVNSRIKSDLGSVQDHLMCDRSAENILTGSSGKYADANAWMRSVPKNEWHPYDAKQGIPAGTAVWYPSSNPHGHVAVSMGGGKVYTTDAFGARSGIVPVDQVFGGRSPIGWSDYAGKDLGTDQGKAVIGLDNRAGMTAASRGDSRSPSTVSGPSRDSFDSSMSGDYAVPHSAVGATPSQTAKRGVLGINVDTGSA